MTEPLEYGEVLPVGCWEVDGWRIRITQGNKSPDDRRIWIATPGGEFHLLRLTALGWVARAWWLNEERLFPAERGFRGGEMVLDYLRDSCHYTPLEAAKRHRLAPPKIREIDE